MKKFILLLILLSLNSIAFSFNNSNNSNSSDPDNFTRVILSGQNGQYGFCTSTAGDVNGDGYEDVIVGAPGINRAYIYFGGFVIDANVDLILYGSGYAAGRFGVSVSNAGDVNNDGYSDVIVGEMGYGSLAYGSAYIYFGGSSMDNSPDIMMIGQTSNSQFGYSVSNAGDFNGDDYDDVIVGAFGYNSQAGRAYIFFGGQNMNSIPDVIIDRPISSFINFGEKVSDVGDVNDDGFSDVIVESYASVIGDRAGIYYGNNYQGNSESIIIQSEPNYGIISVSGAGDVNGDQIDDVIVGVTSSIGPLVKIYYGGSIMNNTPDIILTGITSNTDFGKSVSSAGDVNRDGFGDVIIGCAGKACVFYGGIAMDNIEDFLLYGGNQFGCSVSGMDVNKDGFTDVIVGASGDNLAHIFMNFNSKLINPPNNSINNPLAITFNWKKFASDESYILQVGIDPFLNNKIIVDKIGNDTFKTINGFLPGNDYFWNVITRDTSGNELISSVWKFTTQLDFVANPFINLGLKVLVEGLYDPVSNKVTRRDTISVYLRSVSPPYELIDSSKFRLDSIFLFGKFNLLTFNNALPGNYYLTVKHFNSIETWSEPGGIFLSNDSLIHNYDLTNSKDKAYGSNLKLVGNKYCIYSGDVNQDGHINLTDLTIVYNNSRSFLFGNYIPSDLNGDSIVDLTDLTICYNNSISFVSMIRP